MKRHDLIFLSVTFGVLAFPFACTKDKTPRPAGANQQSCDPNKVYFESAIKPIINSNCAMSGCHDAATRSDGVDLSSYEGIRRELKPGNPNHSKIMEMINESKSDERMPPPPREPLSEAQKSLIALWITQGADNAVCTEDSAGCSAKDVSYATQIVPIVAANCKGCHSGNTISGGVDLSAFSGVQTAAASGKLVNAVVQNGQASPMPKNSKLPPCDIEKIRVWVSEGAKNN